MPRTSILTVAYQKTALATLSSAAKGGSKGQGWVTDTKHCGAPEARHSIHPKTYLASKGAAPPVLGRWGIYVPALPLASPLATLERVASAVFFTENRIECNAPTSTTGSKVRAGLTFGRPALRALFNGSAVLVMNPGIGSTWCDGWWLLPVPSTPVPRKRGTGGRGTPAAS